MSMVRVRFLKTDMLSQNWEELRGSYFKSCVHFSALWDEIPGIVADFLLLRWLSKKGSNLVNGPQDAITNANYAMSWSNSTGVFSVTLDIFRWQRSFSETGSLAYRCGSSRPGTDQEKSDQTLELFLNGPALSIRSDTCIVSLSQSAVHPILQDSLFWIPVSCKIFKCSLEVIETKAWKFQSTALHTHIDTLNTVRRFFLMNNMFPMHWVVNNRHVRLWITGHSEEHNTVIINSIGDISWCTKSKERITSSTIYWKYEYCCGDLQQDANSLCLSMIPIVTARIHLRNTKTEQETFRTLSYQTINMQEVADCLATAFSYHDDTWYLSMCLLYRRCILLQQTL